MDPRLRGHDEPNVIADSTLLHFRAAASCDRPRTNRTPDGKTSEFVIPALEFVNPALEFVIPAKAGIQRLSGVQVAKDAGSPPPRG